MLSVVFAGMIVVLVRMAQGTVRAGAATGDSVRVLPDETQPFRERLWDVAAPLCLLCMTLLLGLYIPPFLNQALQRAALLIGG